MAKPTQNPKDSPVYSESQAIEMVGLAREELRLRAQYANSPLPEKISPRDYNDIKTMCDSLRNYPDIFPIELDFFKVLSASLEGRVDENCDDIPF